MNTSVVDKNVAGQSVVTNAAVTKVFYGQLELMKSIRDIIQHSSLPAHYKEQLKEGREEQLSNIPALVHGLRGLGRRMGERRLAGDIILFEKYAVILESLLDHTKGGIIPAQDMLLLYRGYVGNEALAYRTTTPLECALATFFTFTHIEAMSFCHLHSQLTAYLALMEYRLLNGALTGKYDHRWTKNQDDAGIVHRWVSTEGIGLCMPSYRLNISQMHARLTGKQLTGM